MIMSEFDEKAISWDDDPTRVERAVEIANFLKSKLDLSQINTALEYGSGTGLLSFELQDNIANITLMDASEKMTEVALKKVKTINSLNLRPVMGDLLTDDFKDMQVDLIYCLLTLHHVVDSKSLLEKFNEHLMDNGKLAIIDLETEDGSFHEGEFHGHKGFSKSQLTSLVTSTGFASLSYDICYTIQKTNEDGVSKSYPVFMLIAEKQ